jgi:peptidoglycan/LPS O-acetylase OafA/YrhL
MSSAAPAPIAVQNSSNAGEARSTRSGYLPTLDGWRGLAILGVLACHGLAPLLQFNTHLADLALQGRYGVDVFFALSGLLITSRLVREHQRNASISLKNFYIRRCFRILPPYFSYLAVIALLSVAGFVRPNSKEWLSCLFFWRNYLPKSFLSADQWYLGHFWSLSVEEQFYLLWPTLLVITGLRRARWVGLIVAIPVALFRLLPDGNVLHINDPFLDKLLFGAVLALWLSQEQHRQLLRRFMSPLVFAVLMLLAIAGILKRVPFAGFWLPFVFPLMIAGTIFNVDWLFSRFLENVILRWIGRLSYGIYVWQQLFLTGIHPRWFALQHFPLNFVAILAVATVSYYAIERPLIAMSYRLTGERKTTTTRKPPIADKVRA